MSINFDDLLKKAKKNVSPGTSEKDLWNECINVIMHAVHKLNEMYVGKIVKNGRVQKNKHNIRLEQAACKDCSEPMFVLAVRQFDDMGKVMRYHKGGWKYLGENKYYCDKCRKD